MSWLDKYEEPSALQLKHYGVSTWKQVTDHSEILAPLIHDELVTALGALSGKKVLDFGCGIGRISLKLHHMAQQPTHLCDVNDYSIDYMKRQLPEADVQLTGFEPPLPYESNFFDALFSISIWTHLHPKMQIPWLMEMHRILKPGGYAMISIAGDYVLPNRKKTYPEWESYTENDVRLQGQLFLEYKRLNSNPENFPGITESYGTTIHDHEFVRRTWGCLFSSLEIRDRAVARAQDLVILRK